MNEHPSPCLICGQRPKLTDDGSFVEEVYAYQRIGGKIRLVQEIVLGTPLYFAHAQCRKA